MPVRQRFKPAGALGDDNSEQSVPVGFQTADALDDNA